MNAVMIIFRRCGRQATISHHRAVVKKHIRCNRCVADDAVERRARRKLEDRPIPRNKDRAKQYEAERRKQPAVKARRAADMRRYQNDPTQRHRHEARWLVRRAVAAGRLVRKPCEVCGATPAEGHHDDYNKPLDVRWLCPQHHREHHARVGGAK